MMELHLSPAPAYGACGIPQPDSPADLAIYLLPSSEALPNRAYKPLVLICPGGAYSYCSDREAEPIAAKYLGAGFHAAVLRYHCAPYIYPTALLELAWSVAILRRFAQKWQILPHSIFVCGFSAGGHLAASLGTLWQEPLLEQGIPSGNWKPDGQILAYPVLTLGTYTHAGSRDNLLGVNPPEDVVEALSLEKRVTTDTVPTFLWHTVEDGAVPVENSLQYASALQKYHIPFELHLYEKGGHGLSTCEDITSNMGHETFPDNQSWMDMSIRFIRRHMDERRPD